MANRQHAPKKRMGRPPKPNASVHSIKLSRSHVDRARELGEDNLTRGIERAIDIAKPETRAEEN